MGDRVSADNFGWIGLGRFSKNGPSGSLSRFRVGVEELPSALDWPAMLHNLRLGRKAKIGDEMLQKL